MSAEIPGDLAEPIRNLERQALELIAKGNYEMAKNIYRTIYETLYTRQFTEKRRIHMGAPLHMMGLTLLFQNNIEEAFRYFLLAYITDTLNVRRGHEDEADGAPACRALQTLFGVADFTLQSIKEMARSEPNRNDPFDVERFLKQLLCKQNVKADNLLTLSTRKPSANEIKSIRGQLFQTFFVTESGRALLDTAIKTYGSRVLSKAAEIAEKEGHPKEIRESDVKKAILELHGKGGHD
jgi:histone H3/H4